MVRGLAHDSFSRMLAERSKPNMRSTGILRYDLSTMKLSVIYTPLWHSYAQPTVLMTAEDNDELGFATVYDNKLYLWAREAASNGDAGWAQNRVIELKTLLPPDALCISPIVVGFADCIGVFYLETVNGLFSIKLKSSQVKKVQYGSDIRSVVPYMSFCTPALGTGTSSEEPGALGAASTSEEPGAVT